MSAKTAEQQKPEEQVQEQQVQEQQAAAGQEQQQPDAGADPALEDMRSQLDMFKNQGYEGTAEYKQLEANYQAMLELAKGTPPAQQQAAPAATAEQAAQGGQAAAPAPGSAEALSSAFFGKITPDDGKAVEFRGLNDVTSYLAEKLGLQLEADKPESFLEVVSKAEAWKKDAADKPVIESQHRALVTDIENLPSPLFNAMQAWAKGQDWKGAVASADSAIDFSKDLSDADKAAAINHYFPGKFKPETIVEGGDLVDGAFEIAKSQFKKDQTAFVNERKSILAAAEQANKARLESVTDSMTTLKKDFPALDNNDVQKVKDVMEKGNVMSLFVDEHGKYLPDAAKRLAMVIKGEDEIKNLVAALKKRTDVARQIVDTGREEIERPGAQQQASSATATDLMKEAAKYMQTSPYRSRKA
jgi:hypothetical protein